MKHKRFHFNVESYFNKVYDFQNNEEWALPEQAFCSEKWSVPTLQEKKEKLNSVKEQLSQFDLAAWSLHTKKRDPSTLIIKNIRYKYQPELLTQAWCKFYECLSRNNLLPSFALEKGVLRSLHICEAPGGFISALNHYIKLFYPYVNFHWLATTLNPDYEGNPLNRMIPDDRLIKVTRQNWLFGEDHTGDITKYYNFQFTKENEEFQKFALVTADGSVNCMDDPGDQERNVSLLHYCEVINALSVLEEDGTFVLKIFTMFEESTICLLFLLNCTFQSVSIFKPITSKSGNSELYVICKQYKGFHALSKIQEQLLKEYKTPTNLSMFDLCNINADFIKQVHECAEYFMQKQIETITDNIKYFTNPVSSYENARLKALNGQIANLFFNMYSINSINRTDNIAPFNHITSSNRNKFFAPNNMPFMYYYNNKPVPIKIQNGKRIFKILYSNYCSEELLDNITFSSINRSNSLFNIAKIKLCESMQVFDIGDFDLNLDNGEFNYQMFCKVRDKFNCTDMVFVNVPFVSNALVSFLYILSSYYSIVYFLKGNVILLRNYNRNNDMKIKELFNLIDANYRNNEVLSFPFEVDLLNLIEGIIDDYFMRCICVYNNNLLIKKK